MKIPISIPGQSKKSLNKPPKSFLVKKKIINYGDDILLVGSFPFGWLIFFSPSPIHCRRCFVPDSWSQTFFFRKAAAHDAAGSGGLSRKKQSKYLCISKFKDLGALGFTFLSQHFRAPNFKIQLPLFPPLPSEEKPTEKEALESGKEL